jgi:hypothetical protein
MSTQAYLKLQLHDYHGWMDGWMDGWVYKWIYEWMDMLDRWIDR